MTTKGRVLVIDDDEWVCRLLSVAMREAGFEISISESAADGFFRAVEEQPDCIVCDVDLPDHNGYWVARRIRSHPSRVSTIPFVFLSGLDDREHRLEGFQVGGDAYLTKPFRIDEVVAQVDAFIQMAARLRKQRQTLASIPPSGAAMTGDLGQMSVATLLTLLDLERRSGRLELKSGERKAGLVVLSGNVVATTIDDVPSGPLQTLRTTLNWNSGKFSFTPSTDNVKPEVELTPINALLMEAARLEDEERKDDDPDATSNRISTMLARAPTISTQPPSSLNIDVALAPVTSAPPPATAAMLPAPLPAAGTPAVAGAAGFKKTQESASYVAASDGDVAPTLAPGDDPSVEGRQPTGVSSLIPAVPAIDPAIQLLAGEGLPDSEVTRPVDVPVKPTGFDKRPPAPPLKSSLMARTAPAGTPGPSRPLGARPLPPPAPRSLTPRSATPAVAAAATGSPKPPGAKDSKPGMPAVNRTAFGAALRSLSPSKPIRAVTPPAGSAPAVAPSIADKRKEPTPSSDSIDTGWSEPPAAGDDQTKKPGDVE